MLETLAGRLTWEHSGTGIRVQIPARRDWIVLFLLVWLASWSLAGGQVIIETFTKSTPSSFSRFNLLWLLGWAAGECFAIASVAWGLTGRTILLLDPSTLEIERYVFAVRLDKRTFSTTDIRNLRYMPAGNSGRNSRQSQIKFEANDKTHGFASGISDVEAFKLIDKMLTVFNFPKDRALEYLDLSR